MMNHTEEPRRVVEYVVLKGIYHRGLDRQWEIGDRLMSTDFTQVQIVNLIKKDAIKEVSHD